MRTLKKTVRIVGQVMALLLGDEEVTDIARTKLQHPDPLFWL